MLPQQIQEDVLAPYYDLQDSQMLKLRIQPSKIVQSGMGLFATSPIETGQIIAQYYGSIISSQHANSSVFNLQQKMVQIDQQYSVISRGPASRCNDIVKWNLGLFNSPLFAMFQKKRSFPCHQGVGYNAGFLMHGKTKAFLVASREIKAGEQIYIPYGFDYWHFFYKYYGNNKKQ